MYYTYFVNMKKCVIIMLTFSLLRASAAMEMDWQNVTGTWNGSASMKMGWQSAAATWYGSPNGDGSEGGACGYGNTVQQMPYSSNVAAGNPVIFKGGEGCGQCYQVKCTDKLCSQQPVTVSITDECPGCGSRNTHFDLSGTAFGAMSAPGKAAALRNKGILPVLFKRTPCRYAGWNIAFQVDKGATDYWFSVAVKYVGGDGDLGAMSLMQSGSKAWQPMRRAWGAVWVLNGGPLKAPFSIRLQSLSGRKTLTAKNVIPEKWQPNGIYKSFVNF